MNQLVSCKYVPCLMRHVLLPSASSFPCLRFSHNKREFAPKKRQTSKFKYKEETQAAKKMLHRNDSHKPFIEVYSNANIEELAAALDEDLDIIKELVEELDSDSEKYLKELKPLDKVILSSIFATYKVTPKFISRPVAKEVTHDENQDLVPQPQPPLFECVRRAPVVTIMGHVDHGKTTLLDALRKSRVVDQEFGGITQHIGAFSVQLPNNKAQVTFIDTPGHSAFKAMRMRGANATDIVVLVVAADDGVMEQTIESIKYAREAGAPFVVAINKCDKPTADPERVKRELMELDIIPESYGGDVQCVEVSALTKKNLDALQEAIIVQAEIMDLKTTPEGLVEGIIIESTAFPHSQHCTMIVQRGTLKSGSLLVAGECLAHSRLMDEFGKPLKEAGPSTPVQVLGWKHGELPHPGDRVFQVENEVKARRVITYRRQTRILKNTEKDIEEIEKKRAEERKHYEQLREEKYKSGQLYFSLFSSGAYIAERTKANKENPNKPPEKPKLSIIIRTDVDGTLEAILNVIDTYTSDECDLDLVDFGVGPPKETIVDLAATTKAMIFAFNVQIPQRIHDLATMKKIRIEEFNVIYRLVDALKNKLSEKLPPIIERKTIGEGHVLKEFLLKDGESKKLPIAGCLVDWGTFKKDAIYRFTRTVQNETKVLYEGPIEAMKIVKEVVNEAKTNQEVGLSLDDKAIRFKQDDSVQVFEEISIPQRIDWNPPGF